MSLSAEMTPGGATTRVTYASKRQGPQLLPASARVRVVTGGVVKPADPGTLEFFLVERYILYAYAAERLFFGRVHHTPYPLQTAYVEAFDETLLGAAGILRPDTPPLAHYAAGVSVDVYPLEPVELDGRRGPWPVFNGAKR